ncbi:MAG: DEAD/DEAH box helicase family protein [Candidatus Melainabacteria bacterium]|nr:DEAD/DEAH box helicase family protein [Candidatus Melainabacteria bacterium]
MSLITRLSELLHVYQAPKSEASEAAPSAPKKQKPRKTLPAETRSSVSAGFSHAATELRTSFFDKLINPIANFAKLNLSEIPGLTIAANTAKNKPSLTISTKSVNPQNNESVLTNYQIAFAQDENSFSDPGLPNYGGDNLIEIPRPEFWDHVAVKKQLEDSFRSLWIGDPVLYSRHNRALLQKKSNDKPALVLTEYQKDAVKAVGQSINAGKDCIVEQPTGTGKTIVALESLKNHLKDIKATDDDVAIFLVRSDKVLTDLRKDTIPTFFEGLGSVHMLKGADSEFKGKILLAGPITLRNFLENNDKEKNFNKKNRIVHVIVDEVQDSQSIEFSKVMIKLKSLSKQYKWNTRFVGYSATPFRNDKKDIEAHFDGGIVYRYSKRQAWKEGYLPTLKLQTPEIDKPNDLDADDEKTLQFGKTKIPFWKIRLAHQNNPSYNGKTFISVTSKSEAIELQQYLKSKKIPTVAVYGNNSDISAWEKPNSKRGSAEVLIAIDKLNVGADIRPGHIIVCRNIISNPLVVQLLGRGLRPDAHKSHLLVSDLSGFSENSNFMKMILSYFQEKIENSMNNEDLEYQNETGSSLVNNLESMREFFKDWNTDSDIELDCYHLDKTIANKILDASSDIPSFLSFVYKNYKSLLHDGSQGEHLAFEKFIAKRLGIAGDDQSISKELDDKISSLTKILESGDKPKILEQRNEFIAMFTKYRKKAEPNRPCEFDDAIDCRRLSNKLVLDYLKTKIKEKTTELDPTRLRTRLSYVFYETYGMNFQARINAENNLRSTIVSLFPDKEHHNSQYLLKQLLSGEYPNLDPNLRTSLESINASLATNDGAAESLDKLLKGRNGSTTYFDAGDLQVMIYLLALYATKQAKDFSDKILLDYDVADQSCLCLDDFYQSIAAFSNKAQAIGLIKEVNVGSQVAKLKAALESGKKANKDLEQIRARLLLIESNITKMSALPLQKAYSGLDDLDLLKDAEFTAIKIRLKNKIRDLTILSKESILDTDYQLRQRASISVKSENFNKLFYITPPDSALFSIDGALTARSFKEATVNYISFVPAPAVGFKQSLIEKQYSKLETDLEKEEFIAKVAELLLAMPASFDEDGLNLILFPEDQKGTDFYARLQSKVAQEGQACFGPVKYDGFLCAGIQEMPEIKLDEPASLIKTIAREPAPRVINNIAGSIVYYKIQVALENAWNKFRNAPVYDSLIGSTRIFINNFINNEFTNYYKFQSTPRSSGDNANTYKVRSDFVKKFIKLVETGADINEADLAALSIILCRMDTKAGSLKDPNSTEGRIIDLYLSHRLNGLELSVDHVKSMKDYLIRYIKLYFKQSKSAGGFAMNHVKRSNEKCASASLAASVHEARSSGKQAWIKKTELDLQNYGTPYQDFESTGLKILKSLTDIDIAETDDTKDETGVNNLADLKFHYSPKMGTLMWLTGVRVKGNKRRWDITAQPNSKNRGAKEIFVHLDQDCSINQKNETRSATATQAFAKIGQASASTLKTIKEKNTNKELNFKLCHSCCGDVADDTTVESILKSLDDFAESKPEQSQIVTAVDYPDVTKLV